MFLPLQSFQLITDASKASWCGVLLSHQLEGTWPQEFAHHSSNSLELRAILLSLQHFATFVQGKAVMDIMVITMAVAYLLRQGSYLSNLLMELLRSILTYSFRNKITLIPKYIIRGTEHPSRSRIPVVSHPYEVVPGSSFSWLLDLASRYGVPKP